ncbi:hypothetical protein [Viridibacillus arvi]|uniref:hypothetical protein n=1 Tax=Viridibacillus arvi TaxID=263475 RepID=UPI003D2924F8
MQNPHENTPDFLDVYALTFVINCETALLTINDWKGVPYFHSTIPTKIAAAPQVVKRRFIRMNYFDVVNHLIRLFQKDHNDDEASFTADTFRLLEHLEPIFTNESTGEWWE